MLLIRMMAVVVVVMVVAAVVIVTDMGNGNKPLIFFSLFPLLTKTNSAFSSWSRKFSRLVPVSSALMVLPTRDPAAADDTDEVLRSSLVESQLPLISLRVPAV